MEFSKIQIRILSTTEIENYNHFSEMNNIIENIQHRTNYLQILSNYLDNDFQSYYIIVTYHDELIAWTYFFIDNHFGFQGILSGFFEKIYTLFPIKFRTTFVSSPIAEYNAFHVKKEYMAYENYIIDIIVKEIVRFSKKKKISLIILKDHIKSYSSIFLDKKFKYLNFMPSTIVNLSNTMAHTAQCEEVYKNNCLCFDYYLANLKKMAVKY